MQVATLTLEAVPVRVLTLALRSALGRGPQEDSELELELNCGMEFGLWNGTGLLNGIGSWMKESYLVAYILMLFVLLNFCYWYGCWYGCWFEFCVDFGVDVDTGVAGNVGLGVGVGVSVGVGVGVGVGDGSCDIVYVCAY